MTTGSFSAGQQVATTVNAIAGNPGMVAIAEASFSGAATCFMYDCFSREYESYFVVYRMSTTGASGYFGTRLMNRNTVYNSAIYGCCNLFSIYASAGALGGIGNAGFTEFLTGYTNGPGTISSGYFTVEQPYSNTELTTANWQFNAADLYQIWGSGIYNATSRATGFAMVHLSGGTCTGYIAVYGVRN